MSAIASQITSLTIVYSIVYSDADQRKHQSSASLAFVRGIHRGPVNSPHKWPVTRKMFPFDDVIMKSNPVKSRSHNIGLIIESFKIWFHFEPAMPNSIYWPIPPNHVWQEKLTLLRWSNPFLLQTLKIQEISSKKQKSSGLLIASIFVNAPITNCHWTGKVVTSTQNLILNWIREELKGLTTSQMMTGKMCKLL